MRADESLVSSVPAEQQGRRAGNLPRSLPVGDVSLPRLALGKTFVGKMGCVPLGCSSPLQFDSMRRCSVPSSDSSFS